jgi:hypothetical protein
MSQLNRKSCSLSFYKIRDFTPRRDLLVTPQAGIQWRYSPFWSNRRSFGDD